MLARLPVRPTFFCVWACRLFVYIYIYMCVCVCGHVAYALDCTHTRCRAAGWNGRPDYLPFVSLIASFVARHAGGFLVGVEMLQLHLSFDETKFLVLHVDQAILSSSKEAADEHGVFPTRVSIRYQKVRVSLINISAIHFSAS